MLAATAVMLVLCGSAAADAEFAGMGYNGTTAIHGARVSIQRYNPIVNYETSSAWSMVLDSRILSPYAAFAQVGYLKLSSWNQPWYFYEYADAYGNDPGPQRLTAVPNGGNYTGADDLFTVQFVSGGYIKYRINGNEVHSSGHDWTPETCEWMGEIHATSTHWPQFVGDATHKVHFTRPALFSTNDDNWHGVSPDSDRLTPDGSSKHGRVRGLPDATDPYFHMWDDRY
ncbi:MAG TPA: hypothetical protein VIK32_10170 [Candidatus Limnocylindrales bacterium]